MRVTVTGGLGYIGACAVEEIAAGGNEVRVLDSFLHPRKTSPRTYAAGAEIVRGDVRERTRARAFEGADAVIHLAAIVGDPACAKDPESRTT